MKKILSLLILAVSTLCAAQTCVPVGGITCTPNLGLNLIPLNYPNWNIPINSNSSLIDTAAANWAKLNVSNTFTANQIMPTLTLTGSGCTSGTYAKGDGSGCGPGGGSGSFVQLSG